MSFVICGKSLFPNGLEKRTMICEWIGLLKMLEAPRALTRGHRTARIAERFADTLKRLEALSEFQTL